MKEKGVMIGFTLVIVITLVFGTFTILSEVGKKAYIYEERYPGQTENMRVWRGDYITVDDVIPQIIQFIIIGVGLLLFLWVLIKWEAKKRLQS